MKTSDYFFLGLMIFFLVAAASGYLSDSFVIGIAFGVIILILYISSFFFFRKKKGVVAREEFIRNLLLKGRKESNCYFTKLYPKAREMEADKYLVDDVLYINALKYSPAGEEDVAQAFRYAEENNYKNIKMLTCHIDKKTLALANSLSVSINLFDAKSFYSSLKKADLLPPYTKQKKHKGRLKNIWKSLPLIPPKYFIFASVSTAILSFFLPLRLYYLIFSTINCIIGIIAVIKKDFDKSLL